MIKVAKIKDIKENDGHLVQLANGKKIALFKIKDNFYAISDSCPHMGGSLSSGEVEGSTEGNVDIEMASSPLSSPSPVLPVSLERSPSSSLGDNVPKQVIAILNHTIDRVGDPAAVIAALTQSIDLLKDSTNSHPSSASTGSSERDEEKEGGTEQPQRSKGKEKRNSVLLHGAVNPHRQSEEGSPEPKMSSSTNYNRSPVREAMAQ